ARIVPLQPPDGNRIDIDQIAGHSTSKYASTRLIRRSAGPLHIRLAKKAAFTSAGVPVTYHNIGPPSHECRNCHATMWYRERRKVKDGCQPNLLTLLSRSEVRNRQTAFIDKDTSDSVDQKIVRGLIQMLDHYSPIAKAFRMVRYWCNTHNSVNFHLRLHSDRKSTRQYSFPTVSEVVAVIINDFGEGLLMRDVIVNNKDSGPIRVSELHPSYMALQYPLLFPYGEDGFHEEIPYNNNTGTRKTKQGYVIMKEYNNAYSAVEEQQLKWTRNNQDTLRVDIYHNLCDAVTRGDTNAVGLDKRIVLPRTFTGSPRYMMQNYQDAIALCRAYDNPDLFITFTSNQKWPEIAKMESRAVVYVIEFQKRGLPQAHILLWLEEQWKCKTPSKIDDIILAELPSLTDDPEGYKVVTDYMLHGPCGKDARYAACTIDGKCSKHFLKAFLPETFLDEEGYPHYRRMDNKVTVKKGKFTYDNKHVERTEQRLL
ncbi:ATP-dependent DNA helicase PIF1, partial [Tanacetum coccineum]